MQSSIRKILIANRGEIALRVIRTCRQMGINTVAVYSTADRGLPWTRWADESVCLGPAPASQSYLNQSALLATCLDLGVDAVHPGYGFLSENADFAELLEQNQIRFIGPGPAAMRLMGDKISARNHLQAHNLPVVPGYHGPDQSTERLEQEAERIGFPVMLKASAGGGGRGLRVIQSASELATAVASARREAENAFGDGTLFLEKYIQNPRHIEVQILADMHGNTTHVFERECSMQRRHQKVIEESPSPIVDSATRDRLCRTAIAIAESVAYTGAGTVEFIYSADQAEFWFLEMNTRLQVEHPVTEMISGLDLVGEQIRIAAGQALSFAPADLRSQGHSIEARIYAEDPSNQFLPQAGHLLKVVAPDAVGVRIDHGFVEGDSVSIYYDPMIAKLIVHAPNRDAAIQKMKQALQNYFIAGLKTNISFLLDLIQSPAFQSGDYNTNSIAALQNQAQASGTATELAWQALGLLFFAGAANQSSPAWPGPMTGFSIWPAS
ncbi:MAG: acetyl-CoA carboxylase biotin carboxylase subunit [Leptospiraceae bacterium]|nr:acetyl-CoA carboxylase biotin carboxylase subunit [Leptospiraceae bacterium]